MANLNVDDFAHLALAPILMEGLSAADFTKQVDGSWLDKTGEWILHDAEIDALRDFTDEDRSRIQAALLSGGPLPADRLL